MAPRKCTRECESPLDALQHDALVLVELHFILFKQVSEATLVIPPAMDRCKRILRCLVLVLLSRQGLSSANQHHFVRIPLETSDQLRFTGVLHLGSPPRGVRVVFDTGSSDTWVFSINAAIGDEGQASRAFTVGYGGASCQESQLQQTCNSVLGFADDHTSVIPGLDAQGVVGLGMEALAQIHSNSSVPGLLAQQPERISPLVFSLYISSWAQAQPASQLIIGGDDPALSTANTLGSASLSSHITRCTASVFVAVFQGQLRVLGLASAHLSFGNELYHLETQTETPASHCSTPERPCCCCPSILLRVSSGFSPLALARDFCPLQTTSEHFQYADLAKRTRERLRPLQPAPRECTAMIDAFDPSEVSDHLDDVVILGTVFFRAFYARFDYSNKQVSLACSLDDHAVCRGGLQPALDYQGHVYEPYSDVQQPRRSWTGICAALTALALFAGLRTLLQPY
ncbi:Peptidase family A1 domain [Phytophthora cactorum]|nr:Peptidase family A1 domain [Phytophthora cactorum]